MRFGFGVGFGLGFGVWGMGNRMNGAFMGWSILGMGVLFGLG